MESNVQEAVSKLTEMYSFLYGLVELPKDEMLDAIEDRNPEFIRHLIIQGQLPESKQDCVEVWAAVMMLEWRKIDAEYPDCIKEAQEEFARRHIESKVISKVMQEQAVARNQN